VARRGNVRIHRRRPARPAQGQRPDQGRGHRQLRDLRKELDKAIVLKAGYVHYTVRQAAQDWLATGLDRRSAETITKNQNVLEPILKVIGAASSAS
jgi:hypothetical protein